MPGCSVRPSRMTGPQGCTHTSAGGKNNISDKSGHSETVGRDKWARLLLALPNQKNSSARFFWAFGHLLNIVNEESMYPSNRKPKIY